MTTDTTLKILLVEDNELTRIGLKVTLEKYDDIEIIAETNNGDRAVEHSKNLKLDLIIMDIGISGIDGILATKKIKSINPDLKVLILSSRDSEDEIVACFQAGADGYALKESSQEQLYSALTTISNGDTWLSSSIANKVIKTQASAKSLSDEINSLSDREKEVLKLIVDGKSNSQISSELFISLATTKTHVRNLLNKLDVEDRTQAAVKAMREGYAN
jgi:two-component system NarL family response regulator